MRRRAANPVPPASARRKHTRRAESESEESVSVDGRLPPRQRGRTTSAAQADSFGRPSEGVGSDDITRRLPSPAMNTDGVAGGGGEGSHARSRFLCFLYGLVFFFLSSSHALVPPLLSPSFTAAGVKSFAVFIMFTPPRGTSIIFITIYTYIDHNII